MREDKAQDDIPTVRCFCGLVQLAIDREMLDPTAKRFVVYYFGDILAKLKDN